jgi:hypothetical protein
MRFLAVFLVLLGAAQVRAAGIDRDSLLSEAPAVPDKGTVRVTGGAIGTSSDQGVNNTPGQANITGTIAWTPIQHLSGDVGMYWQVGANGPSARVRYQVLSQAQHGVDLSSGVRFKTVGFDPNNGEVELLVAAGRRFGRFELVANGVFGVETGGGGGKDVEGKAFAGYRFSDDVRAGVDSRLQAEVGDEEQQTLPAPGATALKVGRDYDLTAGPAISWIVAHDIGKALKNLQIQALVGVAQPKKTDLTSAVGVLSASVDF